MGDYAEMVAVDNDATGVPLRHMNLRNSRVQEVVERVCVATIWTKFVGSLPYVNGQNIGFS